MQFTLVQLDIAWEAKPENFRRVRAMLAANPPARGAVVVLPEMFSTGFSLNVESIAEGQARPAERFMAELAQQYGVHVLGGVVTRAASGRGLNQAMWLSPDGREQGRYNKMHPFTLGGESDHFDRGHDVVTIACDGSMVAPMVCYDLRFPEAFRAAVRRGVEVFVVIANWPTPRVHHWLALLAARAIENQSYVIGVNRCGIDPNLPYPGRSTVIDPQGITMLDMGDQPGAAHVTLDLAALREYRKRFPALRDIHPHWSVGE